MDEELKAQIDALVKSKKVFLFMKGTPQMPQCGFSMQAANILKAAQVDFDSFDVLENEAVRQGIKEYANWPTIPQLYVDGKFIGGCDIMTQMAQNGELQKIIGE